MLGHYIKTHPRLPHIKDRPAVHLPHLRMVSRTAPSAVIIDTNAQKVVARVFYRDGDRVPILAEQWRVLRLYSPANLKKNLRPVQRGKKHDDLGTMYGYGFRVPQGGVLRATEDVSYYRMTPGADEEWVDEVEDLFVTYSATMRKCAPSLHTENRLRKMKLGLPCVGGTALTSEYVTYEYRSASHVDNDVSQTCGVFVQCGPGSVIGNELLFPKHGVGFPLRDCSLVFWDGTERHCTSLAKYNGAFYIATVLTTPARVVTAIRSRFDNVSEEAIAPEEEFVESSRLEPEMVVDPTEADLELSH